MASDWLIWKRRVNDGIAKKVEAARKARAEVLDLSAGTLNLFPRLTELPREVLSIKTLRSLNIAGQSLQQLPNEFQSLTALERLDLSLLICPNHLEVYGR